MCVIILQIHEVFIFYFCELYHEIIKQDILRKGRGTTKQTTSFIYIIPSTYKGEKFDLLTLFTKEIELWQLDFKKIIYLE